MDNYTRAVDAGGDEPVRKRGGGRLVFVPTPTHRRVIVLEGDLCKRVVVCGVGGERGVEKLHLVCSRQLLETCARARGYSKGFWRRRDHRPPSPPECCWRLVEGVVERCRHRSDTYKSQRPTRNLKPTRFTDAGGKPDDKSDARTSVGGVCTSYTTCACADDVHRSLLTRYRVLYYFEPRMRLLAVGVVWGVRGGRY